MAFTTFAIGNVYRTRDGYKARCIQIDNPNKAGSIVLVYDDVRAGNSNGKIWHLYRDGKFHRDYRTNALDVVADWVDSVNLDGYFNVYNKNGQMKYYFHATLDSARRNAEPGLISTIPVSMVEKVN